MYNFLRRYVFGSLGYIPKSEIAESYILNSMFNFLRNWETVLQSN